MKKRKKEKLKFSQIKTILSKIVKKKLFLCRVIIYATSLCVKVFLNSMNTSFFFWRVYLIPGLSYSSTYVRIKEISHHPSIPVCITKQLHNYITQKFAWFFSKHGTSIIALRLRAFRTSGVLSRFERTRLNAPSCTRTRIYIQITTYTDLNKRYNTAHKFGRVCIPRPRNKSRSHSFPRAHKYMPGHGVQTAALLRAYKFK